jgi:predicted ribonuclease YlaK
MADEALHFIVGSKVEKLNAFVTALADNLGILDGEGKCDPTKIEDVQQRWLEKT